VPKPCYKFCCWSCYSSDKTDEVKKQIENGVNLPHRKAKNFMIKKYGMKCQICNNTSWMGQTIPIILDHIDGDSSNSTLKNIRLICPNCDALLPTYKGRNRGKGRYSRRLRYQQDKSY
jgi:predicted HNH restriction endonuclease